MILTNDTIPGVTVAEGTSGTVVVRAPLFVAKAGNPIFFGYAFSIGYAFAFVVWFVAFLAPGGLKTWHLIPLAVELAYLWLVLCFSYKTSVFRPNGVVERNVTLLPQLLRPLSNPSAIAYGRESLTFAYARNGVSTAKAYHVGVRFTSGFESTVVWNARTVGDAQMLGALIARAVKLPLQGPPPPPSTLEHVRIFLKRAAIIGPLLIPAALPFVLPVPVSVRLEYYGVALDVVDFSPKTVTADAPNASPIPFTTSPQGLRGVEIFIPMAEVQQVPSGRFVITGEREGRLRKTLEIAVTGDDARLVGSGEILGPPEPSISATQEGSVVTVDAANIEPPFALRVNGDRHTGSHVPFEATGTKRWRIFFRAAPPCETFETVVLEGTREDGDRGEGRSEVRCL